MTTAESTTAEPFAWAPVPSPIGTLSVAVTAAGLVRISFGERQATAHARARAEAGMAAVLGAVRRQLDEYFAGRRRQFDLPLDWRLTSGLQRRVLHELYEGVGFGEVVSYQELGIRAKLTAVVPAHEAPRAIGGFMASNPIPLVVPCHRVIASDGGLGGYGGGLEVKRRLLALEGVLPMTLDDLAALPEL